MIVVLTFWMIFFDTIFKFISIKRKYIYICPLLKPIQFSAPVNPNISYLLWANIIKSNLAFINLDGIHIFSLELIDTLWLMPKKLVHP